MPPMAYIRFCLAFSILLSSLSAWAVDRRGRLGIGLSNELNLDTPLFSFKLQNSRSFALGGIVGFDTAKETGSSSAGLKFYHNIFQEPQLYFYSAFLGAFSKQKSRDTTQRVGPDNNLQFNLTLGSEFSFAGLQSLGFSTEVGVCFYKSDELTIKTAGGSTFLIGSVHFYL